MSVQVRMNEGGKKELRQDLDKFIKMIAGEVVQKAIQLCPHDTGRLRNSIERTEIEPGIYDIGSLVPYAAFVEFGTVKMAAQPYLRPAFDEVLNKYK